MVISVTMAKIQEKRKHSSANEEKRPRNAEDTRKRILDAAVQLFSYKSYDSVQTREVAALAGVDAALIHRYFGSKEGLFTEVVSGLGAREPFYSPAHMKEVVLANFTDLLTQGSSAPFSGLRILLFSALSPSVSHIVSAFFLRYLARFEAVLPDGSRTTKANLLLAYVLGTLVVFRLVPSPDAACIDIDMVVGQFAKLLDDLIQSGPHEELPVEDNSEDGGSDRLPI